MALRQLPNFKFKMTVSIPKEKINSFEIDTTGNYLFCVSRHKIYILDMHTFQILGIIDPKTNKTISGFIYSPPNQSIAITAHDIVWIYSLNTGELIKKIRSPEGECATFSCYSNDGRLFASSYNDGYFCLFNGKTYDQISQTQYSHAIVMFSFSSGGLLVSLGFDNGKVLIIGMETNHQYQIKAHHKDSSVTTYFHPQCSMKFMTKDSRSGEVKLFSLSQKENPTCYRKYKAKNGLRLISSNFSCDSTILYGCSSKNIYAWRLDSESLFNSLEFDLDIDSFFDILPSLVIPQVALLLAKSTIWIWNCQTNEVKCVATVSIGQPLFQYGNWYKINSVIVQTNDGKCKIFGCDCNEWKQPEMKEYKGWSPVFASYLREFIEPQITKSMIEYEKRVLKYMPVLKAQSESDSD